MLLPCLAQGKSLQTNPSSPPGQGFVCRDFSSLASGRCSLECRRAGRDGPHPMPFRRRQYSSDPPVSVPSSTLGRRENASGSSGKGCGRVDRLRRPKRRFPGSVFGPRRTKTILLFAASEPELEPERRQQDRAGAFQHSRTVGECPPVIGDGPRSCRPAREPKTSESGLGFRPTPNRKNPPLSGKPEPAEDVVRESHPRHPDP